MSYELEIYNKIKEYIKGKYVIDEFNLRVPKDKFTIKLKYDFKLMILLNMPHPFVNTTEFTITLIIGNCQYNLYGDACNDNYLNDIETCLNKLMDQIHTYEEFIKGFVDSVVTDLYNVEYHINLNTLHVYFKSNNGRAVIYPVIEFGHGGEYVTMYIDSIDGGKYPMKMYSSISFDDAKNMLDFYL